MQFYRYLQNLFSEKARTALPRDSILQVSKKILTFSFQQTGFCPHKMPPCVLIYRYQRKKKPERASHENIVCTFYRLVEKACIHFSTKTRRTWDILQVYF